MRSVECGIERLASIYAPITTPTLTFRIPHSTFRTLFGGAPHVRSPDRHRSGAAVPSRRYVPVPRARPADAGPRPQRVGCPRPRLLATGSELHHPGDARHRRADAAGQRADSLREPFARLARVRVDAGGAEPLRGEQHHLHAEPAAAGVRG